MKEQFTSSNLRHIILECIMDYGDLASETAVIGFIKEKISEEIDVDEVKKIYKEIREDLKGDNDN